MKTLQEIKEEYAKELDNGSFESWEHYRDYNDIEEEDLETIAKRYAIEVAKEVYTNNSSRNIAIINL